MKLSRVINGGPYHRELEYSLIPETKVEQDMLAKMWEVMTDRVTSHVWKNMDITILPRYAPSTEKHIFGLLD